MSMPNTLKDISIKAKAAKICRLVYLMLYVASGIMLFIGGWIPGLVMIAANILIYFLLGKRVIGEYENTLNRANIRYGLCAGMKESEYLGDSGMDAERLEAMKLLPMDHSQSRLLVRQGFAAAKNSVRFSGWEITFHYPSDEEDKQKYSFLSGSLLILKKNRTQNDERTCIVLRKDFAEKEAFRTMISSQSMDPQLELFGYILYSRENDPSVFPVAALEKLIADVPSLAAVRIQGKETDLFLADRFYTKKAEPGFVPSEKQLRSNPLPERDSIFRFYENAI